MALDKTLRDTIADAVSAGFDDQIAFTSALVACASQRGEEHTVQDLIFRTLKARGYAMDRFDMDREALARHPGAGRWSDTHSEAPIVVGIHRPKEETGRSVILQGHVDVVPTGPEHMWTHPPYAATIEGDWMYGRGAGDMKSGFACLIGALDALRAAGYQPAGTCYVQSVVEEESTGNGALMTHLRGYKADAALIPEPTGESLIRANLGVLWFQVAVEGFPVHVQEMGDGANAIDAAMRVTAALRELEASWNARKAEHPLFAGFDHPLNLNIGKIAGGDWASSVPCWATIDYRISILPGWNVAECAKEIEDHITAFARADSYLANTLPKVTFNGFFAEGYVQPEGSEAEAVLARAHESAMGEPLTAHSSLAYLDARVYALFDGIPTLCYGAKSRASHGFDESVSLSSLKRTTLSIALFIAEWCGLEAV
ncbi:ArgE/DapE family deacylase (plasmid) [Paroceanicella profunda]|uniref:ArgE/DapE family deacylase n=1 Tax=Paroceanicella profunda TaxID=2579971 RepID=A0A5B8FJ88_9RHOB|nr:ArgE/DapE family deacylase [Paroceanicella profunda]QDL93968.1 ArgE/DapE family deacylase [Paroceanicella profunda]